MLFVISNLSLEFFRVLSDFYLRLQLVFFLNVLIFLYTFLILNTAILITVETINIIIIINH